MDPAYAAAYRDLYERHWWWRARESFLLTRLTELHSGGRRPRILDVGCGDALFFDQLDKFGDVRGIEPDGDILTDERWRSRIHVGELDADFAAQHTFDWILMLDTLEHVEDDVGLLRAARTALDAEGFLVITVPAFRSLWTRHDDMNHHQTRYTRSTLASAFRQAGLDAIEMRYFFHWLVPLKLLVKVKEAIVAGSTSPAAVPSPVLNRLAYSISVAEQKAPFLRHLPFGTSLFALCQPTTAETSHAHETAA
jgi:SAM-dependent methyltransferase